MTIMNEAVRLFFAVSALILVGMLSSQAGGNWGPKPVEISPSKLISAEPKAQPKDKNTIKLTERKTTRKIASKKS